MKQTLATPLVLALTLSAASAANWPHWRGPAFDGSSPQQNLPEKFSPTENVRWSFKVPGSGGSTPIIWGDRVFLTAAVEDSQKLVGLCLDAGSGREIWRRELAKGFAADDRSNYASPSPTTDGKTVVFFFGTGDLVATDFDGKELWRRDIQKDYGRFAFLWTFSTSPVLHDGRLYLQVLQRNEAFNAFGQQKGEPDGPNDSYLLALDPSTGKELWKQVRPSDAVQESLEAFSTPVPATVSGVPQLLVAGGDAVTGHDLQSGRELWRWSTWNREKIGHWRLVPSPVASPEVVLVCAPKNSPVYAVKGGLSGTHSGEDDGLAWRSRLNDEDMPSPAYKNVSSDVATPLFYNGHFYILNGDRQSLACVEPATGKVLWHEPLGGRAKIEASPTGADGRIYVIDHSGEVFVVKADPSAFSLLHRVDMSDDGREIRSTIAAGADSLFIRTENALYCVGR